MEPFSKYGMEPNQPATLLDRVRDAIRYRHYSIRTEQAYVEWVRRFVGFHGRRHPRDMGADEVRDFLRHARGAGISNLLGFVTGIVRAWGATPRAPDSDRSH